MWIKMSTDQIKAGGIYLRGQQLDLPDRIVAQFDEGSYEKTCAPWDANVPPEQLRLRAAEANHKNIQAKAEKIVDRMATLKTDLAGLENEQITTDEELEKAYKELVDAQQAVQKLAEEEAARKAAEQEAAPDSEQAGPDSEQPKADSEQKAAESEQPQTDEEAKADETKKTEDQKPKSRSPKRR